MQTRKFYHCKVCGNLFGVVSDGDVAPVCCGQQMELLVANSSDGAGEKHVPALQRSGTELTVKVGEVPHPMLPEHYIEWVVISQKSLVQRRVFAPGDAPECTVKVMDGPVEVYAYCNLHGLWFSEA